jgi:hypothetical protein
MLAPQLPVVRPAGMPRTMASRYMVATWFTPSITHTRKHRKHNKLKGLKTHGPTAPTHQQQARLVTTRSVHKNKPNPLSQKQRQQQRRRQWRQRWQHKQGQHARQDRHTGWPQRVRALTKRERALMVSFRSLISLSMSSMNWMTKSISLCLYMLSRCVLVIRKEML